MPDDDFRVVVGGDGHRGANARMIVMRRGEQVGVGSVVLLEPDTIGSHGHEGRPGTTLGERVLEADEVGGGYGRLCDRRAGERGQKQSAEESAHPKAPGRRVAVSEVHRSPPLRMRAP